MHSTAVFTGHLLPAGAEDAAAMCKNMEAPTLMDLKLKGKEREKQANTHTSEGDKENIKQC